MTGGILIAIPDRWRKDGFDPFPSGDGTVLVLDVLEKWQPRDFPTSLELDPYTKMSVIVAA